MPQYSFSDQEFLEVVNLICKKETTSGREFVPIESMKEQFNTDRLDSLGMIIFFVWLAEIFEIPEDIITELTSRESFTVQALRDCATEHGTRPYVDLEEMKKHI